MLKRLITATASIALMATPAMAAGTSSTPAPASAASSAVTPAGERVGGMQALGGRRNFFIIGAAFIAIAIGIYFALKNHDNPPASP